jgi:hypothetical protein
MMNLKKVGLSENKKATRFSKSEKCGLLLK